MMVEEAIMPVVRAALRGGEEISTRDRAPASMARHVSHLDAPPHSGEWLRGNGLSDYLIVHRYRDLICVAASSKNRFDAAVPLASQRFVGLPVIDRQDSQ